MGSLLPAPATQRLMIAVTAGAIGGIFVKRLIELVTDDVYQRPKSLPPEQPKHP